MNDKAKEDLAGNLCPRCSGEMINCKLRVYGSLTEPTFVPIQGAGILTNHDSPIGARICSSCGYAEVYAMEPQKLSRRRKLSIEPIRKMGV